MDIDPTLDPSQRTRRDFIKRTAAAGTVVWAAPAILSVSGAGAVSPAPCATCAPSAYGVFATGTVAGLALSVGPFPQTSGALICDSVIGPVTASALCVETISGDPCSASATVAWVDILDGLVTTGILTSDAAWSCDCSTINANATIAGLTVGGAGVAITGAPNQVIAGIVVNLGLGLGTATVTITANEQSCSGGVLSVNALVVGVVVVIPLVGVVTNLNVIIAHTEVTNGCTCPIPFP